MNEQELLKAFAKVESGLVAEAMQPVSRKSPVLLRVFAGLAATAAVCAGVFFGMRWFGRLQGITYAPGYSDNILESAVSAAQTVASPETTVQTADRTETAVRRSIASASKPELCEP